MLLKKYKPILHLLLSATAIYVCHKFLFVLYQKTSFFSGHYYSLETIYSSFLVFSVVIVAILIQIRQKNIDNVGFGYLWLTCIKMALAYILLLPILQGKNPNLRFEKINFFLIFAVFLTIETIVTVKILNNKQ